MKLKSVANAILFQLCSLLTYAQVIPDSLRTEWSYAGVQDFDLDTSNVANVMSFGATGNGITDDHASIVSAITSLNGNSGIVYFPAGNYLIGSTLSLPDSVTLKGDGADLTILTFDLGGVSGNCINIWQGQVNPYDTVWSGYNKGSAKIVVANAGIFAAGDYADLHEDNGSWDTNPAFWADYSVGQIVQVDSVAGDTLILKHPLRIDFDSDLHVVIAKITPRMNVGLECFKIIRIDSTASNLNYGIYFNFAANCRIRGIESDRSIGAHIWAETSTSLEITGNYFHHSYIYDGASTRGYGVVMAVHTGESKIENNIFRHLRHAMMVKQGANGNAYLYNYSIEPFRSEPIPDASGDLVLHGHYAFANLFEGNICQNLFIDQAWGPSGPFNTFFRNQVELYGILMSTGTTVTDLQNFVGNDITGTGPFQGNYILTGTANFTHGNYVQVQGAILPPGTSVLNDTSYYYTEVPPFWNIAEAFPNIGTPNSTPGQNIPARERYLSGLEFAICPADTLTVGTLPVKNNAIAFSLFPSLFSDYLVLDFHHQDSPEADVIFYDLSGKTVFKNRYSISVIPGTIRIETGKLPAGIYFVAVYSSSDVQVFKCVKAIDSNR